MAIEVQIPGTLRAYCQAASEISVRAGTVGAALLQMQREHPALYASICDETGAVRPHVNLFVNSGLVPVRQAQAMATPLKQGDVLTIWPAVSGG